MKEYEIINPSDECYLSGDNFEAVAAACLFLGRGQYALREKDGKGEMPLFLFGASHDVWWKENFNRTFDEYMDTKPHLAIAKVFGTFRYSHGRSSMNNIGKAAKQYAKAFRDAGKERV